MEALIYKDESFKIIGACMQVYSEMGCGFLEPVYQECLAMELALQSVPFSQQLPLILKYKNRPLSHTYEPDFVCYEKIIVEIKAVEQLIDDHRAQVINYLNATGLKLGLLINFGHYPKLEWERFAHTAAKR